VGMGKAVGLGVRSGDGSDVAVSVCEGVGLGVGSEI
jgi:hypothetical protein